MSSAAKHQEKRHFSRIPFEANAVLKKGNEKWECQLLDISLKGVLTKRPKNWQEDKDAVYEILLNLENSDITINMEVSISHSESNHIGFRCEHIDLDSITHLRRLVELNIGDAEILNRELDALGH